MWTSWMHKLSRFRFGVVFLRQIQRDVWILRISDGRCLFAERFTRSPRLLPVASDRGITMLVRSVLATEFAASANGPG